MKRLWKKTFDTLVLVVKGTEMVCDALWLLLQRPNREHRIENNACEIISSVFTSGSTTESRFSLWLPLFKDIHYLLVCLRWVDGFLLATPRSVSQVLQFIYGFQHLLEHSHCTCWVTSELQDRCGEAVNNGHLLLPHRIQTRYALQRIMCEAGMHEWVKSIPWMQCKSLCIKTHLPNAWMYCTCLS